MMHLEGLGGESEIGGNKVKQQIKHSNRIIALTSRHKYPLLTRADRNNSPPFLCCYFQGTPRHAVIPAQAGI